MSDGRPGEITAGQVAAGATTYDAVQMAGDSVWWIESRPSLDGRDVLVRWASTTGPVDVLPPHCEVGDRVHEYGGGAYAADVDRVWFSELTDGRVHLLDGTVVRPITPPTDGRVRYGDLSHSRRAGLLVCVRERHTSAGVVNDVAALPADGSADPHTLVSGADFYAAPRISPNGHHLAWLSWDQPDMPWDRTQLWVADLDHGQVRHPRLIAGGTEDSVFCPQWSPGGELFFVSDRTGWWNLYRHHHNQVAPVLELDAELGTALWELGYTTYTFLAGQRIAALTQRGSRHSLTLTENGHPTGLDLPYTSIKPYLATNGHKLAMIASGPTQTPNVVVLDPTTGNTQELAGGSLPWPPELIVTPEPFTFPTRDGATGHGLYYPPLHPSGQPAPLLVRVHPGPTANAPLRLDPVAQFFTSHGLAVADIDYRGSTGYGRTYRQALNGHWGELDATDCADAARHLTHTRRADPHRIAITGASAGGYTALHALALPDTPFAAATARSPIINPATWRQAAPKFQQHHANTLTQPATPNTFENRSLTANAHRITRPVLLIHGANDPITPVAATTDLAHALQRAGTDCTLLVFDHEGHTLAKPGNVAAALTAELHHYRNLLMT